jgi:hypothetical protein
MLGQPRARRRREKYSRALEGGSEGLLSKRRPLIFRVSSSDNLN